jgi:hypothetical protein
MKTIAERIAAVELELRDIVSQAKRAPQVVPGVGKLSMAHYFVGRVVEEGEHISARVSAMAIQDGGMDFSLPAGDRS